MMAENNYRSRLTPQERAAPLHPYIDPGLVNHRRVETFLGTSGMRVVDRLVADLPTLPDWQRTIRIDHIYTTVALEKCRILQTPTLSAICAQSSPCPGTVICSTETLEGTRDVYHQERIRLSWRPAAEFDRSVVFELSTAHIRADTLRSWLAETHLISFIAVLDEVREQELVLGPLVMGAPSLNEPPEGIAFDTVFLRYDFFEHFVEDIDQFRAVQDVPLQIDWRPMGQISEQAFKTCICQLLGEPVPKDWGGERSDLFTTSVLLDGQRLAAAFLLKGPGSGFTRMELKHLGKNGNQLVRLAEEPAGLLVVQHCNEISPDVRKMLRALAVQPHQARRYCLIDGKDSFRLLTAYGLAERALKG
jgi:hypothetical protein